MQTRNIFELYFLSVSVTWFDYIELHFLTKYILKWTLQTDLANLLQIIKLAHSLLKFEFLVTKIS